MRYKFTEQLWTLGIKVAYTESTADFKSLSVGKDEFSLSSEFSKSCGIVTFCSSVKLGMLN